VDFDNVTAAMTIGKMQFVTSNFTYDSNRCNIGAIRTVGNRAELTSSILADMDAADTCTIAVSIANGAGDTAGIRGSKATTYFSGNLVC